MHYTGANGIHFHHFVARKMLGSPEGAKLEATGGKMAFSHRVPLEEVEAGLRAYLDGFEPVEAVLGFLQKHQTDLIVLAASRRGNHLPWFGKSISAPVTRKAGEMTLLIPGDGRGFVSAMDGSVQLKKILIPIATTPRPEPALKAAARFVQKLQSSEGTFVVLHVGTSSTMPALHYPEIAGWTWQKELRSGEVIEGIVKTAKDFDADLIVMPTDGRNGFLDGLRGSHSERLLRYSATPLLTIPVGSRASRFLI